MSEIDPESLIERVAIAVYGAGCDLDAETAADEWSREWNLKQTRYRQYAIAAMTALSKDPLDLLKEIEAFLAGAESEPDVDLSDRVVARLKEMVATYDNDMRSIAPPLPSPPERKRARLEYKILSRYCEDSTGYATSLKAAREAVYWKHTDDLLYRCLGVDYRGVTIDASKVYDNVAAAEREVRDRLIELGYDLEASP